MGLLREALDAVLPAELAVWLAVAQAQRGALRAAGVPLAERRPLLLRALNKLYQEERLILPYQVARAPGEAAAAFLGRLPAARLKQVLADLEQLTEEEEREEDFIDLGESEAFAAVDETEAA